jgi:hypothetical protein
MTAGRVLSQEELAALVDDALDTSWDGLSRKPLPGVLDTDLIRRGLGHQVKFGSLPRSVRVAQAGSLRLFMEHDTAAPAQVRRTDGRAGSGLAQDDQRGFAAARGSGAAARVTAAGRPAGAAGPRP